jgi:hypothetical protein
MDWTSTGVLLMLAFGANLPLGWWRARQRKFSPLWFVGIHASIPLLIATRLVLDVSYWAVPPEFALVVVGQVAGARTLTQG